MTFTAFPKITRYLNVSFTITEKLDGTNAAISFEQTGPDSLITQSRTRIITPEQDNYGFAAWATQNREVLYEFFGPGLHFGEWWGSGIQKRYGAHLPQGGKWFTPFNVGRFNANVPDWPEGTCPLPLLDEDVSFEDLADAVRRWTLYFEARGSVAVPGAKAEGIMIWSQATGYIKHPFDDGHKWTRGE